MPVENRFRRSLDQQTELCPVPDICWPDVYFLREAETAPARGALRPFLVQSGMPEGPARLRTQVLDLGSTKRTLEPLAALFPHAAQRHQLQRSDDSQSERL